MKNKVKIILWVIGFFLLIVSVSIAYQVLSKNYKQKNISQSSLSSGALSTNEEASRDETSGEEIGSVEEKYLSPDFTVKDKDGQNVSLSDFIGKPVIINFWASWCPPCKAEMPDFEEVYQVEKDSVVFLMINMTDGQRETKEKADNYIKKENFSFPIYYDTEGNAASTYGIYSIPCTLFIDKEGYIASAYQGAISKTTLLSELEQIKQ